MDERHIECPVCGVYRSRPTPHIPSTPWVDDCACNDMGPCMSHRFNPYDAPNRPDTTVMMARAQDRAAREMQDHIKHREEFHSIKSTQARLLESEAILSRVMQIFGSILAHHGPEVNDEARTLIVRYENHVNGVYDGESKA